VSARTGAYMKLKVRRRLQWDADDAEAETRRGGGGSQEQRQWGVDSGHCSLDGVGGSTSRGGGGVAGARRDRGGVWRRGRGANHGAGYDGAAEGNNLRATLMGMEILGVGTRSLRGGASGGTVSPGHPH
jgi:hypothetical protein